MLAYNLYIGNYENVIGRSVYVKVGGKFSSGKVSEYLFKSNRYLVKMDGGGSCYTDKVYTCV